MLRNKFIKYGITEYLIVKVTLSNVNEALCREYYCGNVKGCQGGDQETHNLDSAWRKCPRDTHVVSYIYLYIRILNVPIQRR